MAKRRERSTPSAPVVYDDNELKAIMLNDLFLDSNFRDTFRHDLTTCMRCWEILRTDKDFYHDYSRVIEMKLSGIEEDLLTGKYFNKIPTKVDQLGNEDIAPGYLKLAEIKSNRLKWILEKRNDKYNNKELNGTVSDGAKVVVIIPKREDDVAESTEESE